MTTSDPRDVRPSLPRPARVDSVERVIARAGSPIAVAEADVHSTRRGLEGEAA